MFGEVEAYYGGEHIPGDPGQIQEALFGPVPVATVLIARDDDGDALGFASYSTLFPAAGADKSVFLKELFVRESARRQGVGGHLMDAVQAATAAVGSRLEWLADTSNPAALAFYAARGAQQRHDKVVFRLEVPR